MKYSEKDVIDFYENAIRKKNAFRTKTNKKVLINSLNANLDASDAKSSNHPSYSVYKDGDKERLIPYKLRADATIAYDFMKFIQEEIREYIFTDRIVREDKPIYRHPVFKNSINGFDFVIGSNMRVYDFPVFDEYGRVGSYSKEKVPAMRITLAHDSKIKQLFFSDTYSFNIVNKVNIHDNKNFKEKNEPIEVYLPRIIPAYQKTKSYYLRNVFKEEDDVTGLLFVLDSQLNKNNGHDIPSSILSANDNFEEVIIDTTIFQSLYEELILNIEKRLINHKMRGDNKLFQQETNMFSQFCIKNSIFLDAYNNLLLKNHNFIYEMQITVFENLINGYVPFLTNFKREFNSDLGYYFDNIKKLISKVKDEDTEKYVAIIYAIVKNLSVVPIPMDELNDDVLDFFKFLRIEINSIKNKDKDELGMINILNTMLNEKYPLKVEKMVGRNFNLLDCLEDGNSKKLEYENRNLLLFNIKQVMEESLVEKTKYFEYMYLQTISQILRSIGYDLTTNFEEEEKYSIDIEIFYEKKQYLDLPKNLEVSYVSSELSDKELIKLVELITRTMNGYFKNNILELYNEHSDAYNNEYYRGSRGLDDQFYNERIIAGGFRKLIDKIDDIWVDQLKRKTREECLLDKAEENSSSSNKLIKETKKKI